MDKTLTAKHITLETANKMLPLVTPITRDVVDTWKKIAQAVGVFTRVRKTSNPEKMLKCAQQLFELTQCLNENIDELEGLGCVVESYEKGVVDFPSMVEGEEIMLCWTLGEQKINHYHRLGQTCSNRLLLTQILE